MGASKIEQIIEDIYEFVESCKMQPFSSTKVIVPKEELYDLLDELRLRTPDEIKQYQKVLEKRDFILQDAQEKANAILQDAQEKTSALIEEHEIMQKAYCQANEIVNNANKEAQTMLQAANQDADEIRSGAISYADEMLKELSELLKHASDTAKQNADSLLKALQNNLDVVQTNRQELNGTLHPETEEEQEPLQCEQADSLHLDEDAFLEHIN